MSESFADHPVSLSEARANREHDGRLWTARDALIDLLRSIDSGETDVGDLVICYSQKKDGEHDVTRFSAAYSSFPVALGLLTRVQYLLNIDD